MIRIAPIKMVFVTTLWLVAQTGSATPINGSFESATFAGWELKIPQGHSHNPPGNPRAGTASVVSNWGIDPDDTDLVAPVAGRDFAALGTLARGNFHGNQTYNLALQQHLWLAAGDTLSGWAAFYNGDYTPQDSAWVKIFDPNNNLITTAWSEHSGGSGGFERNSSSCRSLTAWTQWSWTAPRDGAVTLNFGMTTSGDNNLASYGFFDDVLVVPAHFPVPEPSALSLAALGAALIFRGRKH